MTIILAICAFSVFLPLVRCEEVESIYTSSGLTDGLFWLEKTQQLFFVDTLAHKICTYNANSKKVFSARVGNGLVSFSVPVDNHPDKFVVGSGNDILLVTWDGNSNQENPPMKKLISVDKTIIGNRINYGRADPTSRLWFGTLNNVNGTYGHNLANLYSLDAELNLVTQIPHISFSSGFAWSLDNKKFYFDDSLTFEVAAYDYNIKLGTVGHRDVVLDLKANKIDGLPGRLAIDADDSLFVPLYGGSRVIRVDPHSKKVLRSVKINAARIGACTFGGPSLTTLYVSTIGYGFDNASEKAPPHDKGGSIFAVTGLGVKGLSTIPYKLDEKFLNP
ncbi:regucalcin-like isoform X1 [Belonocnema kinseyi]|uniref:regucalcin-like isoform X1 n=1 Tax=Belonocnema kinseyi TaxID=2817044 RepID=UPI00143DEAF3|nr:regucalcin-like isoform X1 [Belonocnema kinseyi]